MLLNDQYILILFRPSGALSMVHHNRGFAPPAIVSPPFQGSKRYIYGPAETIINASLRMGVIEMPGYCKRYLAPEGR